MKQVSLKNFPIFSAIHIIPSILTNFPVPADGKTSPKHDAATTMLHGGDGVLGVMGDVGFAPDIAFSLMVKKLNFSLI